mmetsp:Transcript_32039/g.79800  ORF Transcript_32039/g.79800 Transcript_32039/m.79800 type:complete len:224 (-) Transcript_32039:621-1292(-)
MNTGQRMAVAASFMYWTQVSGQVTKISGAGLSECQPPACPPLALPTPPQSHAPSPPFAPKPATGGNACDEVNFVIAGTIDTFDAGSFLANLASLAEVAVDQLFIKSVVSSSISVVVGVLPDAASSVQASISSIPPAALSDKLNVSIELSLTIIFAHSSKETSKSSSSTIYILITGAVIVGTLFLFLGCFKAMRKSTPRAQPIEDNMLEDFTPDQGKEKLVSPV